MTNVQKAAKGSLSLRRCRSSAYAPVGSLRMIGCLTLGVFTIADGALSH